MRVFVPNTIEQFAWASVWTFHPTIKNYLNRDLMRRIAFLLGDSHDILPNASIPENCLLAAAVALEHRLIIFPWFEWFTSNVLLNMIYMYARQHNKRILMYCHNAWPEAIVFQSLLKCVLYRLKPMEDGFGKMLLSNNTSIDYNPNFQHEPQGIVDWAIFCDAFHAYYTIETYKSLKHVTIFHGDHCEKNVDWKQLGFKTFDAAECKKKNWIFY
jgi:hypothetical protein